MPIYEYACSECGHEMERLQKMSDEPLRDCPACEKPGLRKKISAAGFRLKGGGWYETDFKQGNKRNIADGGKEPAGGSSKSPGGSADGAPDSPSKGAAKADKPAASSTGKTEAGAGAA